MRQTTNQATRQETSDEAFAAMPRGSAQRVYEAIAKRPMCVDDLMIILNMSHSTCSAAANRLMRDGWIVDLGDRGVTRSGRSAIVWHACPKPNPVTRTRPTRAQLLERIADCIAYLETNSPPKRRAAINILRGGTQ
jgi:hypothetical protein